MALIELNLSARDSAIKYYKLQRRREMRKWRALQYIYFDNETEFGLFLDIYNWKKRPVEKSKVGGLLKVKFLDYKPPKEKHA